MKELKTDFIGKGQVKGFEFTQLKKTNYGYIYAVNSGDRVFFEVFERKENKQFNCISYPGNKSFGIWAWTCGDIDRAYEILEEIRIRKEVQNEAY